MSSSVLRPMLDANSSRVFNVISHTQRIRKADTAPERLFFNSRAANNVIVVKNAFSSDKFLEEMGNRPVKTKLFFPFNEENPYEGGKSIIVGQVGMYEALEAQCALSKSREPVNFDHDIAVIKALDQIPTLDPFLMRDKFENENIAANNEYFEIEQGELSRIRSFIHGKMGAIATFAIGSSSSAAAEKAVANLTEKLWEARDMNALGPVIAALRLPPESALASIYAWKGLIYYDYEMNQQKEHWRALAEGITSADEVSGAVTRKHVQDLRLVRQDVTRGMRTSWEVVRNQIKTYHDSFDLLFVHRKSPEKFVELLKNAADIFWSVGDHMSRINHASAVWKLVSKRYERDGMPYDPLLALLNIIRQIFNNN